ncbi:MAG TPA: DUF853 family protein [candidate division Zixibacteria bacterium]|nr:DUF853 family protein [candidate division Zixibacteria bacterium]MDD4917669.1 DUF853 family protein [candidate division Zixibacteria bacterium]HOD65560.1 DUF853 family protein [candidate division Zixibacteria bacterium]HOZ06670.1 DUF853 family protein [candidate division Zixibacteria bacterium]HPC10625.1 DUF853 family protein [candidate division Zixibacteria bacterium]
MDALLIAKAGRDLHLLPRMANRHGMIAGATGTGKTVTLQVMAEQFSRLGVPVFLADVKGDLAGLSQPGGGNARVDERLKALGVNDWIWQGCPVRFWDVYGEQGHPVRTTVSDMGPLLLSRLLDLNDTQAGVLSLVFRLADDNGLLLVDMKDLRAMLQYAADNSRRIQTAYGNISPASVGAIQRALLALEEQGGDRLLGEPALDIDDLRQTDGDGRGVVNILAADRLLQTPRVYTTFLLWLLSELFEQLPEAGDLDKPKLVFFFDEAHLLFDEAPKVLVEKIEQVVRLIRSRGVGVYFISQNPLDVPDDVLGQLGNRVQHALRAFTPKDQKAVRSAAETFRANPALDVERAITELATGEALVSLLDAQGSPSPVERALIYPPHSRIGAIAPETRRDLIGQSPLRGRYETLLDRESAYEMLRARADRAAADGASPSPRPGRPSSGASGNAAKIATSIARSAGSQLGRELVRGVLGSLFGRRRR